MGIKCGEKAIEQFFDWLTPKAARHPGWFILLPMLLTCMFLPGLWKVRVDDDLNYLYTPINGRGLVEKAEVERLYHMNFSTDFDQSHLIDIGFFARVLLIPTDKGDVFRSSHFEEVFRIHDTVMDTTITWKGKKWGYKQLCAKSKGECYQEKVLKLRDRLDWINNTEHCVKFPIVIHKTNWSYEFYGMSIGKPTLDNSSCVRAAKAMGIIYHLDSTSPGLREPILLWLDTFLETMRTFSSEYLDIERFTSESISQEIERTTLQGIYFFSLTILTVGSFAVGTCLMMDWVRSKPFIGIIAFIGTVQAFFISSGLLLYLGMGFISMNMSIPFIMAGIGVDDAFVLLAAWRRTNLRDDVEKRLTTAYKQAGVSITVTSLTNLASFMAGCITPVRAVQIFCLYSSVSVIFTFFFQITFFAGCMTLLARAERRNLHSVTCLPIPPKSKAKHRHILYQLLCTGGVDPENPHHPLDNPEHLGMVLCRDWLGWFLSFPVSKVAVILAFAVYLVGAGMGCARVKQGVELYHLFSYNSYAARASYLETQYQYQYMFRIQLVVNEPLEYHKQSVRDEISNMMKRLTQLEFIADSELTESWLNYYTNVFQTEPRSSWLVRGFNITRKKDFYNCLRFAFLRFPPAQRFLSDINFNDNYTQIVSSRFYVNTEGLKTIHDIQNTMMEIRKIVDSMPFKVIAFNSYFPLLDLNTIIFDIAFMAMLASSGIVMLITVIFISSFVSCLFIALAIASIEVGLIGYLAWWDVSLNPITIVGLIMCIGLSVDNVAHISHAYVSSSIRDPNKRMAQALYRVGVPILQSAGSTVAGTVLFALFPPSYTYLVLFKTICLIMIFSSAHSLLLVPVLLTIFDRSKPRTPENQPKLLVTDDRCGPPQKGTPECQPMILVSSSEDCLK